jgi:hypothetical protein
VIVTDRLFSATTLALSVSTVSGNGETRQSRSEPTQKTTPENPAERHSLTGRSRSEPIKKNEDTFLHFSFELMAVGLFGAQGSGAGVSAKSSEAKGGPLRPSCSALAVGGVVQARRAQRRRWNGRSETRCC